MKLFSYIVLFLSILGGGSNAQELKNPVANEAEIAKILSLRKMDIFYGNKNAPVVVIDYSCPACPGCAYQQEVVFPVLKAKYIDTGKLLWIKRFLPKNKQSFDASKILYCLREEPKLPKYIDILFEKQNSWAYDKNYVEILENIFKLGGISGKKIHQCLVDQEADAWMNLLRAEAVYKIGLEATPTIYLNGKQLRGSYTLEFLKSNIEGSLNK